MFCQKGSYVLARAVGRISCQEEFAHASVDEAGACSTLQKSGDFLLDVFVLLRVFPGVGGIVAEAFDAEKAGAEFTRAQAHIVAPEELEADGGGAFVLTFSVAVDAFAEVGSTVFEGGEVLMGLACSNASESEPS